MRKYVRGKKKANTIAFDELVSFFLGERWERDEVQERAESRPAGGK